MSWVENPAAFPSSETHPSFDWPMHHFGMSLRDWFAGQAFAVCFASINSMGDFSREERDAEYAELAIEMYHAADAMLVARQNGGAA